MIVVCSTQSLQFINTGRVIMFKYCISFVPLAGVEHN